MTRRCTLLIALVFAGWAAGCADPFAARPWPTLAVDKLDKLAARYPHAPAVVLRREDRYSYNPVNQSLWQAERYEAIAILTEGGEKYAHIAVPVGRGELRYLRARTTSPDGTVQEVRPEEVHEAYSSGGALDDKRTVKVFRLPNAHAGSIIEYTYGFADNYFHYALSDVISAAIPVQHYHLEIADSGPFAMQGRIYNSDAQIKQTHVDGREVAVIDADDVPAWRHERYAPPPTVTEPWWILVVTRINGDRPVTLFDTWADAMFPLAERLYVDNGKLLEGLSYRPELAGCPRGSRCAIEEALDWVNRQTELSTFTDGMSFDHPLSQTIAAHAANNFEKAVLLRYALEVAGVRSRYALVARSLTREFDRSFPQPNVGDHLVLVVDPSPVGAGALFLDPSCEWCTVGQIPPWLADRTALGFYIAPAARDSYDNPTRTEWLAVRGEVTPASSDRRAISAQLDASGAVEGRIERELAGPEALDLRLHTRTWLGPQWQKELDALVRRHSPVAEPRGASPSSESQMPCSSDSGTMSLSPSTAA
jgi:hypothetical protein